MDENQNLNGPEITEQELILSAQAETQDLNAPEIIEHDPLVPVLADKIYLAVNEQDIYYRVIWTIRENAIQFPVIKAAMESGQGDSENNPIIIPMAFYNKNTLIQIYESWNSLIGVEESEVRKARMAVAWNSVAASELTWITSAVKSLGHPIATDLENLLDGRKKEENLKAAREASTSSLQENGQMVSKASNQNGKKDLVAVDAPKSDDEIIDVGDSENEEAQDEQEFSSDED